MIRLPVACYAGHRIFVLYKDERGASAQNGAGFAFVKIDYRGYGKSEIVGDTGLCFVPVMSYFC